MELRARQGDKIGDPFGVYRPREKAIILYSLPRLWVLDMMSKGGQRDLEASGARVSQHGREWHVYWPSKAGLAVWFFKEVVTHELGHHFAEQYKNKARQNPGTQVPRDECGARAPFAWHTKCSLASGGVAKRGRQKRGNRDGKWGPSLGVPGRRRT